MAFIVKNIRVRRKKSESQEMKKLSSHIGGMMNEKQQLHVVKERQSSEDWQDGVRLENRLRKIESDLSELSARVWWFYLFLGGLSLLVIGSLIHSKA